MDGKDIFRKCLNIEVMFNQYKDIDQMIYDAKLSAMRYIAHYIKYNKAWKAQLQIIRDI